MKIYKSILLLIILFLFSGCTKPNINNKSNKSNKSITLSTEKIQSSENSEKQNFYINYKEYTFSLNTSIEDVFKNIGKGNVSDKNNWGFIGWDESETYKFFSHKYPIESPVLNIIVTTHVKTGETKINQIDLSLLGTPDGIKAESSVESLLNTYGEPSKIITLENDIKEYYYIYDSDILAFKIDTINNTISEINLFKSSALSIKKIK